MEAREKKGFYHLCTDGYQVSSIFKEDSDFIAGANRIAICKHIAGVSVFSFTLMDNHIHCVLYGSLEQCRCFIRKYIQLTSMYNKFEYNASKSLRQLKASIIPIFDESALRKTISYVHRNPIKGGFRFLPSEYMWSSSYLMFKGQSASGNQTSRTIQSLSLRERRSLLRTHISLPGDWLVDVSGLIDYRSYVEYPSVERLFKSPVGYIYFLSQKNEGEIDMALGQAQNVFLGDKELRCIVKRLIQEKYNVDGVTYLNIPQRLEVARRLKYEYFSTPKQIARLLNLNQELLKDFI